MKITSLRQNLLCLAGVYGLSLAAAVGCPGPSGSVPAPGTNATSTNSADETGTAERVNGGERRQLPISWSGMEPGGQDVSPLVPAELGAQTEDASPLEPKLATEDEQVVRAVAQQLVGNDSVDELDQPSAPAQKGPRRIIDPAVIPAANRTSEKTADKGGDLKAKFDPIKVNGTFFDGWKKPKLAILITGRQDGYLEPCGCAGIENQKGGLSRRHTLIKDLRSQDWPIVAVDVGGLVRRFGKQAEIQFSISEKALKTMGYQAVGFGGSDLRLSAGEVAAAAAGDNGEGIFVSANANLFGLNPKFRIIEAGGYKIGITSVIGPEYQKQVNNAEVEFKPAAAALKAVVPELAGCDIQILLAHATTTESIELSKQFPNFNYVVTAGGPDEPPATVAKIPGGEARLIEVGHKGMYAIVLGIYDDPKQAKYQRVALDSRFKNSAEMKQLMTFYQDQLRELGWDGLGLKRVNNPRGKFVGVEACKECHPTAYKIWEKTKHAHATETLTKLDPPRQYDAECVSCHTVGWNPQEYFAYVGGFDSMKTTPQLAGNQCENCHGPGAAHVAAENGKKTSAKETQREAMKLMKAAAQDNVCGNCHDMDNSPEFHKEGNFEKYWSKIEHRGKR